MSTNTIMNSENLKDFSLEGNSSHHDLSFSLPERKGYQQFYRERLVDDGDIGGT